MFTLGIIYDFENNFVCHKVEGLGIYSTIYNGILRNI